MQVQGPTRDSEGSGSTNLDLSNLKSDTSIGIGSSSSDGSVEVGLRNEKKEKGISLIERIELEREGEPRLTSAASAASRMV